MDSKELKQIIEDLRSMAQNDYMIDQHFLPPGVLLNRAIDALEEFLRARDEFPDGQ